MNKKTINKTLKAVAIVSATVSFLALGYVLLNKPGAGKGNFRSTHRSDGRPKLAFKTRERANLQALKQLLQHGEVCYPYEVDGKYYTGHRYAA